MMPTVNMGRLSAALRKEFRLFLRDPVLLTLVLWLYTVEVVICAVALTFSLKEEPVAVYDLDRSAASRELADRFDLTPSFRVAYHPGSPANASALLDAGKTRLLVAIPPGYGAALAGGRETTLQLLVDGTNSMTGMMALGEAQAIMVNAEMGALPTRLESVRRAGRIGALPVIENRIRIWYNPDLRFAPFMVLSMLAIAVFMVGVIHPAASLVREKEAGTIEQLAVTPLGTFELVLAKTLPTFVIGLLGLGPGLVVARFFGVPFRGDPLTFLLISAVFLMSAVATGLVIGSLTRTLQQALLVSFFVLFPVLFLSGTMMPIETMPRPMELATRLSPLRYYMEAILGVFMKGVGLAMLRDEITRMLVIGVALFGAGTALFHWRTS